ncbi:hypothetical protein BJV74DRAFT_167084 [Russula compacta]|nr:hypothetical protein BJV74DRAFT_167084 [Russula compacta]
MPRPFHPARYSPRSPSLSLSQSRLVHGNRREDRPVEPDTHGLRQHLDSDGSNFVVSGRCGGKTCECVTRVCGAPEPDHQVGACILWGAILRSGCFSSTKRTIPSRWSLWKRSSRARSAPSAPPAPTSPPPAALRHFSTASAFSIGGYVSRPVRLPSTLAIMAGIPVDSCTHLN